MKIDDFSKMIEKKEISIELKFIYSIFKRIDKNNLSIIEIDQFIDFLMK